MAAIGGLMVLLGLLDLADFLLVRAGKRTLPGRRRIRDARAHVQERGDPRRKQG